VVIIATVPRSLGTSKRRVPSEEAYNIFLAIADGKLDGVHAWGTGHVPGDRGWAYHEVVVRDGRVYDAFTGHQGLTIGAYKALWTEHGAINFSF
jgi:hypothetical protein